MGVIKCWTNLTKEHTLTTYGLEEPAGCYHLFHGCCHICELCATDVICDICVLKLLGTEYTDGAMIKLGDYSSIVLAVGRKGGND